MSRLERISQSPIDRLIGEFDTALRAIAGGANYTRPDRIADRGQAKYFDAFKLRLNRFHEWR